MTCFSLIQNVVQNLNNVHHKDQFINRVVYYKMWFYHKGLARTVRVHFTCFDLLEPD